MADEAAASPASKRPRTAEEEDGSYAVRSAEGDELRWPRQAANRAGTLKDWIDETGGEGTFATTVPTEALRALQAACMSDDMQSIAALSVQETANLLDAANFLEATEVSLAGARHLDESSGRR